MTVATRRAPLAQLAVCRGCGCGRTDRGKPDAPVDALKAVWAAGKLNRAGQLTVSGCLGPCDAANVPVVLTPTEQVWLGGLADPAQYAALVAWSEECQAAAARRPVPAALAPHRLDRWASGAG